MNFMDTLKLMRKPDFHQSLGVLMIVDMMIVRKFCWTPAMMKHFKVSLIL